MEGNISSNVKQLSLQSVGSFFRRSHRTTDLPRVAETESAEKKIEKRSGKEILTLGYTFLFCRSLLSIGMKATRQVGVRGNEPCAPYFPF